MQTRIGTHAWYAPVSAALDGDGKRPSATWDRLQHCLGPKTPSATWDRWTGRPSPQSWSWYRAERYDVQRLTTGSHDKASP